jgi:hypothetical protein
MTFGYPRHAPWWTAGDGCAQKKRSAKTVVPFPSGSGKRTLVEYPSSTLGTAIVNRPSPQPERCSEERIIQFSLYLLMRSSNSTPSILPNSIDQTSHCWFDAMLTDAQIAVLRDIGPASKFSEEKKAAVLRLVVHGYIERDGDLFKLTAIGLRALLDKGTSWAWLIGETRCALFWSWAF